MMNKKSTRLPARWLRMFDSLGLISVLVLLAMILTTITGAASTAPGPQAAGYTLMQIHDTAPESMKIPGVQQPPGD